MAAALAAAEAVGDAMSPKEKAAEVGLAVAESAAAAGMSLEEQMEAHRWSQVDAFGWIYRSGQVALLFCFDPFGV